MMHAQWHKDNPLRRCERVLASLPEPDWDIIGVSSAAGWSYPKELRQREKDHAEWHRANPARICEYP